MFKSHHLYEKCIFILDLYETGFKQGPHLLLRYYSLKLLLSPATQPGFCNELPTF